ncbi:very short patch repair endonuclease [Variovorax sp. 350MFTsu5.1]|uniref:very short patch repair endonuclease n=1 Tax=Variovorax sp. 350MFTsu5.1 TaxID=3158365 RepID=UPI003AB020C1
MSTKGAVIDIDAAARSANMARIRGKDTGPEVALRQALWRSGLRYRLGMRIEGARPDLVFPGARLVVFVDGCFWHGCPLHYVRPRSREDFWGLKLASNTDRDRRQTALLRSRGWRVIRIWEHELEQGLGQVVEDINAAYRLPHEVDLIDIPDRPMVVRVDPAGARDGIVLERRRIESLTDPGTARIEIRERRVRSQRIKVAGSARPDPS